MSYMLLKEDREYGPYELEKIKELWKRGEIPEDGMCRRCTEFQQETVISVINAEGKKGRGQPGFAAPKSRLAYILLALLLGAFGVHNFYIGRTGVAVCQLLLTVLLFWTIIVPIGVMIWIFIEMCVITRDGRGNPLT